MIRRIRFRIWSPEEKVMIPWLALCQSAFNVLNEHTAKEMLKGQGFRPLMYHALTHPDHIQMLWTGMNDKNGVPIYEGDLVSAWSEGVNLIGHIKWGASGRFFIQVTSPVNHWNLSPGGENCDEETCEVIGNIYEHPEKVPNWLRKIEGWPLLETPEPPLPEPVKTTTMKAISIRQPWAWLTVHGPKRWENRDWDVKNPGRRFSGTVLIHAGKGMTRDEYATARALAEDAGVEIPAFNELKRGGIIGQAEFIKFHDSRRRDDPWSFTSGFEIGEVKPLPFFEVPGKLGFFNVELPQSALHD